MIKDDQSYNSDIEKVQYHSRFLSFYNSASRSYTSSIFTTSRMDLATACRTLRLREYGTLPDNTTILSHYNTRHRAAVRAVEEYELALTTIANAQDSDILRVHIPPKSSREITASNVLQIVSQDPRLLYANNFLIGIYRCGSILFITLR